MTPKRHLSITPLLFLCALCAAAAHPHAAEPKVLLEEPFTEPLAAEWFWGLGTWTAKDGVLRGFESGERRHGPAKVRRFQFQDATLDVEFRLERGARMIGIGFNGPKDRGHLVAFVVTPDILRIIGHPKKGETVDYIRQDNPKGLPVDVWHRVRFTFRGETLTVDFNGETYTATHPSIAEEKHTFSLGGDSGGPDGEKAGALEFRKLVITQP